MEELIKLRAEEIEGIHLESTELVDNTYAMNSAGETTHYYSLYKCKVAKTGAVVNYMIVVTSSSTSCIKPTSEDLERLFPEYHA